ncbi:MAG: protein kinase domain-containing protein [Actinomycetota bacterium]
MDLHDRRPATVNARSGSQTKVAGRYRLNSSISRGGFTDLWKAEDEVLGRTVALKIMRPEAVTDGAIKRLFRVEALAAARLTHSNIISVFDTGEDEGTPFLVMEYLGGGSLRDVLDNGPINPLRAAQWAGEICSALAHAHQAGIVHGDIRPENVLFTETGHLKVSDFAIARAASGAARGRGPATGPTSAYACPENDPDARGDLFSLGVVLFECLAGSTPDQVALPDAEGVLRVPRPGQLRKGVPMELDAAVLKLLSPDPGRRYQNALTLRSTLEALVDEAQQSSADPSPPAPARRRLESPPRTEPAAGPEPGAAPSGRSVRGSGGGQAAGPEPGAAPSGRSGPAGTGSGGGQAGGTEPGAAPSGRAGPVGPGGRTRNTPAASKGDSFLRTEGRWLLPALALIAGAVLVALNLPGLGIDLPSFGEDAGAQELPPLRIERSFDYDPPPGDGKENSARIPRAFDGNPETTWATSSYRTADFGRLKPGVGVAFDLGTSRELSAVEVTSVVGGWRGTIRFSDDGTSWSAPSNERTASSGEIFPVSGSHRYWMLWITELVRTPGEGTADNPFAVAIRQIKPLDRT